MGMSIEETIGLLERGSQYNYYDSAEDFCKAYDMAIDTMRKYQKIQEIMSADLEHIHPLDRDKYIVASIKEVISNVD